MASARKQRFQPDDPTGHRLVTVRLVPVINQAGVVAFKYTPGFRFQVVRIRSFCSAKAGAVTANVKVGTRTACALTFTAATENAGSLSATLANLRGLSTEALSLEYTTDGTGALTDGYALIVIRPFPMRGEVASGDA